MLEFDIGLDKDRPETVRLITIPVPDRKIRRGPPDTNGVAYYLLRGGNGFVPITSDDDTVAIVLATIARVNDISPGDSGAAAKDSRIGMALLTETEQAKLTAAGLRKPKIFQQKPDKSGRTRIIGHA